MASAESGEEAAMEPVGGRANEENEHLSDNDEIAADGDIEDDKKGSTRVQKVNKQETRLQRVKNQDMFRSANKAILDGEFVWKVKPEPYIGTLRHDNCESRDDCERRIHREIMTAYEKASKSTWAEEEGEVEVVEFEWRHHRIHWEKFLKIDWDADDEDRFADSNILEKYEKRKKSGKVKILRASDKARQMMLARHYHSLGERAFQPSSSSKPSKSRPGQLIALKTNVGAAASQLYAEDDYSNQKLRSKLESQFDDIRREDPATERTGNAGGRRLRMTNNNKMDSAAAEDPWLLRQTPRDMMFVAVDKRDKLIAFLIPSAIQDAFRHEDWVKDRMETDTRHFYTHIKKAKNEGSQNNQRHKSESSTADENDTRGTDHYGHWHATGQTHGPMVETADSHGTSATVRQVLLHYLENTGGTMTKILDFWFGVWEPELRQEYRDVYEKSPKFARPPPTNADRPEIYTMRVNIVNRKTDVHKDASDWKGGLTGLIQIGDFTGSEMCLKELGIRLDGYQSGAMLLFRGTEMAHYTNVWDQDEGCRYAFEHTTHESVRRATQGKQPYKEYERPDFPEDDEFIKSEGGVKFESDPAGSGNAKVGEKKAKAPARSGKRPQKKRSSSESADDDNYDDFKPESRRKKRGRGRVGDNKDDVASSQQPRRSKRNLQPSHKPSDI